MILRHAQGHGERSRTMKNPFTTIFFASKTVLARKGYQILFTALTMLTIVLFVLVPVWSVPGNDISFQLSLFTAQNWLLFAALSPLVALLLTVQVFAFRCAQSATAKTRSLGGAASGIVGGYAGILGGVFATAACSWCVAAVFGFLGTGTVLFIAQNQLWAVLVAISILLFSLYFTSKKIVHACDCAPPKS